MIICDDVGIGLVDGLGKGWGHSDRVIGEFL